MNKIVNVISGIAGIIAIVTAVITLIWFFFGLDSRIKTLEGQMQAIYQSATVGVQSSVSKNNLDASITPKVPTTNNKIQNLVETCSTLALKAANAYENGTPSSVGGPLEKMMDNLGCNKIQQ
ncbi:hypothetical protein Q2V57_03560 [Enterobacter bugandensis]|uniref:hypothetical protein n=1 Tax=Enterobacter TaxID=547 RepID=UPI002665C4CE|nr:hypothetical protein [Enterobacter bugandensis]MDO2430654.1 hypothetical protein [Enterobacter bugandensis]MDO2443093.1 hypothetical protein [Enterobacter bugandensis]